MGTQISPGVQIQEIDLSTVVNGVATTGAVIAGPFSWGPANERTLVDSELTLSTTFGNPTNDSASVFFTAASFLQYGNNLNVVRTISKDARNAAVLNDGIAAVAVTVAGNGYAHVPTLAVTGGGGTGATLTAQIANNEIVGVLITNPGSGYTSVPTITLTATGGDTPTQVAVLTPQIGIQIKNETDYEFNYAAGQGHVGEFAAKYAGDLGNGIQIYICDSPTQFTNWIWKGLFTSAPGTSDYANGFGGSNDELHIVVVDSTGGITGTPGDVIETFGFVSKASDATDAQGASIYYPNVIDRTSNWIRWMDFPTTVNNWGTTASGTSFDILYVAGSAAQLVSGTSNAQLTFTAKAVGTAGNAITVAAIAAGNSTPLTVTVVSNAITIHLATDSGAAATSTAAQVKAALDGSTAASALITSTVAPGTGASVFVAISATNLTGGVTAIEYLVILEGGVDGNGTLTDGDIINGYDSFNVEEFSFGLILTANHSATVVEHCITEISEERMDNVTFLSPPQAAVVNNAGHEHTDSITFRNSLPSSSYAFMDGNWIKKYDRYNDLYRWIPANGDVAGLCVRTDQTRDPWFSPAGLNRGNIKGVIGLAWNPREAFRDVLYQAGINPIVAFPGQGAVLYGDKTMLSKPSAFDRINVRRLFIVIEQAIKTASQYTLFEFNDEITRAQFRGLIDPFLRDVQGRRGLYDYRIVCDATNNTPQVIDTNNFAGDIYLQPAKSINFILLRFVATRTGIDFSEVVGQF